MTRIQKLVEQDGERLKKLLEEIDEKTRPPMCICLMYIGDNGPCPVHGEGHRS